MSDYYRYFLKHGALGEREVSREEFIRAERMVGFWPKSNDPNALATAGFSGSGISGRIEYQKDR